MPIAYNPSRAYQPARMTDVHAELVQSLEQRRRQARQERYARNRMPTIAEDMEVEPDSPYVPYAHYPPGYAPRDEL